MSQVFLSVGLEYSHTAGFQSLDLKESKGKEMQRDSKGGEGGRCEQKVGKGEGSKLTLHYLNGVAARVSFEVSRPL